MGSLSTAAGVGMVVGFQNYISLLPILLFKMPTVIEHTVKRLSRSSDGLSKCFGNWKNNDTFAQLYLFKIA